MQYPHTVTIVHPGDGEDVYHAAIDDWANATRDVDVPAWLQQSTSEQVIDGRRAIVTVTRCFFPPETSVGPRDRIEHDGVPWRTVGDPRPAPTPFGAHHLTVELERAVVIPTGSEAA